MASSSQNEFDVHIDPSILKNEGTFTTNETEYSFSNDHTIAVILSYTTNNSDYTSNTLKTVSLDELEESNGVLNCSIGNFLNGVNPTKLRINVQVRGFLERLNLVEPENLYVSFNSSVNSIDPYTQTVSESRNNLQLQSIYTSKLETSLLYPINPNKFVSSKPFEHLIHISPTLYKNIIFDLTTIKFANTPNLDNVPVQDETAPLVTSYTYMYKNVHSRSTEGLSPWGTYGLGLFNNFCSYNTSFYNMRNGFGCFENYISAGQVDLSLFGNVTNGYCMFKNSSFTSNSRPRLSTFFVLASAAQMFDNCDWLDKTSLIYILHSLHSVSNSGVAIGFENVSALQDVPPYALNKIRDNNWILNGSSTFNSDYKYPIDTALELFKVGDDNMIKTIGNTTRSVTSFRIPMLTAIPRIQYAYRIM